MTIEYDAPSGSDPMQLIRMLACDVRAAKEKAPVFKAVPLSSLEMIFATMCACADGANWKCPVHGDIGVQDRARLDCKACDGDGKRMAIDPDEQMAVETECGACGGRGSVGTRLPDQYSDGDLTTCETCNGAGYVATVEYADGNPYQGGEDCKDCKSTGFKLPAHGLPAHYKGVVVNNNMPRTQVILECPPNVTIPVGVTMIACPHPNLSDDCCIWCGKNMLPNRSDFEWLGKQSGA